MNYVIILIMLILVNGCTTYEKYLSGSGHKYAHVVESSALKIELNKKSLSPSDRFGIPKQGAKLVEQISEVIPPDY